MPSPPAPTPPSQDSSMPAPAAQAQAPPLPPPSTALPTPTQPSPSPSVPAPSPYPGAAPNQDRIGNIDHAIRTAPGSSGLDNGEEEATVAGGAALSRGVGSLGKGAYTIRKQARPSTLPAPTSAPPASLASVFNSAPPTLPSPVAYLDELPAGTRAFLTRPPITIPTPASTSFASANAPTAAPAPAPLSGPPSFGGLPAASAPPPPLAAAAPAPHVHFPALHLTPLNDTFVPKQISLAPPGTRVKIGRQTNAKTVPNGTNGYFDSKVLSRMHAEVWCDDGKVFIKDVKSSNGTFINGARISPEAQESDVFELHTDDIVEFGIDITSDDTKSIIHHKVAAKVYLVMNPDDVAASSREFTNWYRNASEAPQHRRPVKAAQNANNGVSFEHVLNRLAGELQKSRDTGTTLGDLSSTLNDVHDTLGGGAPPSMPPPPFPLSSHPTPYASMGNGNGHKDVHAQSIAALQSQLNETQNSLAGHVGKIRDLEGLLAEHEVIKREVGTLRKQMEDAQRDMGAILRGREGGRHTGRESPIAALLNAQEADDEDDARSVSSVETIRLDTAEQLAALSFARPNGVLTHINGGTPSAEAHVAASTSTSTAASEDVAHGRDLQEQNAKLSTRLEALSAELDEATKLGQSLRSQHAEASSTIRALEARVHGLEKAVEGRVAAVEGKVLQEVETRWMGWKEAFEAGWKKERESWDSEREKLVEAVREWEERKKRDGESDASNDWDEDSGGSEGIGEADADDGDGHAARDGTGRSEPANKGPKGRRPRSKRRRRSTAARVSVLAAGVTGQLASDSDSTIGDSGAAGSAAILAAQKLGGAPASLKDPAWDEKGLHLGGGGVGSSQAIPYASAGAVVLIGVAAAWALSMKLKE